ncbi:hypothetical protein GX48_02009 [Paracoccidioides brasiliensis]|nr:hypothetical protein GX48_02009 [Paracoccidioides brasiliensis]
MLMTVTYSGDRMAQKPQSSSALILVRAFPGAYSTATNAQHASPFHSTPGGPDATSPHDKQRNFQSQSPLLLAILIPVVKSLPRTLNPAPICWGSATYGDAIELLNPPQMGFKVLEERSKAGPVVGKKKKKKKKTARLMHGLQLYFHVATISYKEHDNMHWGVKIAK